MKLFKKTAIAAAVAVGLVASGGAFADATISNGSITAAINDGGTFVVDTPTGGGTPGLSWNGIEFVNIDVPSSWWTLSSPSFGTVTAQYNSNPLGTVTVPGVPAGEAATTFTTPGAPFFTIDWKLPGPGSDKLTATMTLTNAGTFDVTDLVWGVGFDPDQGGSGVNQTVNTILGVGNAASVSAYRGAAKVTLSNITGSGADAIAAYIGTSCCSVVDPNVAIAAAQGVGFSNFADDSISLNYRIGTLAAGQSVTLGWEYTFAAAIPEPETYAMLLAGLGLMGFVARRRKLRATA